MARINIEDQFWTEITDLISESGGDKDKVYGNVLRFFKFAQDRFKEGRLITDQDFIKHKFLTQLKDCPLFVEKRDGGYMVAGAEKHFGWLKNRVEGGRKGGKSKSDKKLKAAKANLSTKNARIEIIEKPSEAQPKLTEAQPKPTEASPSPSPSRGVNTNMGVSSSPKPPEWDLNLIYQEYPKRHGEQRKGQGMQKLWNFLKSKKCTYDQALMAVRNYRKYLEKERKVGTTYVKQFGTFFDPRGDWLEWFEPKQPNLMPQAKMTDEDFKKAAYGGEE